MTWFRVDDKFHDHPKVRKLRADKMPAVGLWSMAGSWAADNLTDGFVPTEIVQRFDPKERYARRLVDVGLWSQDEQDGEFGYRFHEWTEYQPTKTDVRKQREDGRERVRRWREKHRNGQGQSTSGQADDAVSAAAGNGDGNALPKRVVTDPETLPRAQPFPTQPIPNPTPSGYFLGGSRESNAREEQDPPRRPRCAQHQHLPDRDPGPNCRRCEHARLTAEQQVRDVKAQQTAVIQSWRAVVNACPDCDDNGLIETPAGLTRHHGQPGKTPHLRSVS